jgi:hypothetical protein
LLAGNPVVFGILGRMSYAFALTVVRCPLGP